MKPMLNGGCGRIILPGERPHHHQLVDPKIYSFPNWVNADRNPEPGVDCVVDLFQLPWPFEDDTFSGALFSHFMEHIPHEIKLRDNSERAQQLARCQDGWYALWAEVFRVCENDSIIHVLSPYGWSQGAAVDPTHTRLIFEHTFTHSMQPDPNSPFKYETGGINFEMVQNAHFNVTEMFGHLAIQPGDNEAMIARKQVQFQEALMTRINVVYELYVKLRAVKE